MSPHAQFISDSRAVLSLSSEKTGDAPILANRLAQALEIIEEQRATMRAAHSDIMKRYDVQAANRLANMLG